MLRVELTNIIFTVINLLILYYFLHRFLFKPVREVLEKRRGEIDSSYKDAEEAKRQAEDLRKQYETSMNGVEAERREQLEKTKLEASQEYDEIIGNARQKAERILSDAKLEAEKEAKARQHEMQEQMALLVAQAAYKIAASKDSSENDSKLYDTFLKDAGKGD